MGNSMGDMKFKMFGRTVMESGIDKGNVEELSNNYEGLVEACITLI